MSMLNLFIKDFYLKNGLIPVEGFSQREIKSFHDRLESLSPSEKRKAKRKFRKFVRKMNIETGEPTKKTKRSRRRSVHMEIMREVNRLLEENK